MSIDSNNKCNSVVLRQWPHSAPPPALIDSAGLVPALPATSAPCRRSNLSPGPGDKFTFRSRRPQPPPGDTRIKRDFRTARQPNSRVTFARPAAYLDLLGYFQSYERNSYYVRISHSDSRLKVKVVLHVFHGK